jgi:gluconate:H+ symporter, GntP family
MEGFLMILILVAAVAFIVVATSILKLHPFIALLLAAIFVAITGGVEWLSIANVISGGFGGTLTSIGVVIVLGTIIGVILEKSGAAIKMADVILKVVGPKRPALAMSIIGWIVSIPVFCDSGFVILSSLRKSVTRRTKSSAVTMTIALSTGLFAAHTLVPPTPGPIAAAGNLGLENQLGLVILFGLFISIFTMLAGYAWAKYSGRNSVTAEDLENEEFYKNGLDLVEEEIEKTYGKLPSTFMAFAPIFIPILFIAIGTVVNFPTRPFGEGTIYTIFAFLGNPINALIIGLLFSLFLLPKFNEETLHKWIGEGVSQAGPIILITGAGGAFGAVIKATPIADYLGTSLSGLGLGIFVPFILAAALKTAQGSSTTSLVTTSALMMPLLAPLGLDSTLGAVLTVMAIGAGALTVSHSNDSYFWVVSQFSGMDVKTAYKTHTVATLIQGIVTIVIVALLAIILL